MDAAPDVAESSQEMQRPDPKAAISQADGEALPKGPVGSNIEIVTKGISVILLLIALAAIAQLYFSIQEIIGIWLDEDYVPVANSIYYVMVIAGCIYAVFKIQSRRFKGA